MTGAHFHAGRYGEAVELVKRHHYSRRAPSNVQCVGTFHESGGLFGDYGPAVAACFFSLPPTRWGAEVWELSRLVRDEHPRPLTELIAKTCRIAKAKGAHLLVSFADRTQGHHGGIYQAASWRYAGARDRRMDGVILEGVFIPGRSANSKWGTQSPSKLSELLKKAGRAPLRRRQAPVLARGHERRHAQGGISWVGFIALSKARFGKGSRRMTTIPDDEATRQIRACDSIPALARLTQSWSADNKRISPFARIVMDVKQAELWRALKPGAGR